MELNSYDWNYLFQVSPYGDLLGRTNYVLAAQGGRQALILGLTQIFIFYFICLIVTKQI